MPYRATAVGAVSTSCAPNAVTGFGSPSGLQGVPHATARERVHATGRLVEDYHEFQISVLTGQLLNHVAFTICGWLMLLKVWVANAFEIYGGQCFSY